MKKTKIQWCHGTINPVMGCDGCELWTPPAKIKTGLVAAVTTAGNVADARKLVAAIVGDRLTSEIYTDREEIADALVAQCQLGKPTKEVLVNVIRTACKCYAGLLGVNRAGHKGYADEFTQPKLFPGRMADAAGWGAPSAQERDDKPWLDGAPRMIFVSDMGDALSKSVSFGYLQSEVLNVVTSEKGRRHLWLWLTKRPARMAEFGRWLVTQGIQWPDNLVAMTTVTSPATAHRVDDLRKVPSRFKGLSCEPIFAELNLDLTGIDWVIAGGGSDVLAEPFHVEWALGLREQCRKAGAAFFLKQLGKHPMYDGRSLKLVHRHGGDWDEWKPAWRTREIPEGFRQQS
jgi:protein gp37